MEEYLQELSMIAVFLHVLLKHSYTSISTVNAPYLLFETSIHVVYVFEPFMLVYWVFAAWIIPCHVVQV